MRECENQERDRPDITVQLGRRHHAVANLLEAPSGLATSTFVMRHFRKPKTAPISPAELAQKLKSLPQADPRALTATSAAIALSIGSPFYDSRGIGWQATYGAARVAVELAKESSDMFLPLKAVAGAISALIKIYDVSVSSASRTPSYPIPAPRSSKHRITRRW